MWYITNKQKNEVIDTENILVVARDEVGKGWVKLLFFLRKKIPIASEA